MYKALIDTGFFKGLISSDELEQNEYRIINNRLIDESIKLIVPFPILYEITVSGLYKNNKHTKFIKLWKQMLIQERITLVYDDFIRDECLQKYFDENKDVNYSKLSLVDRVIYEILKRKYETIRYIVTGDSELANLCARKFHTEMIMPPTKKKRKS
ncbi:MAG: hypothetical protein K8S87_10945 [Planctomycetes bacterium]|nr:hypothetical protein [Planctomycetota bacterium]